MGQVLAIVYRCIVMHLVKKAGFSCKTARTGAVTFIQRFGSALNLKIHFHTLFLDGVYVECADGSVRFRWVKAPASDELTHLTHTLAHRIGHFLERQALLERDADDCTDAGDRATHGAVAANSFFAPDVVDEDSMAQLLGHSINGSATAARQPARPGFRLAGQRQPARCPAAAGPIQ
jgi:hypothetical protein